MLDVSILFKIGAIGMVIVILDKIFQSCDKKDYAVITNLVGIIIILLMLLNLVNQLFTNVKTLFQF